MRTPLLSLLALFIGLSVYVSDAAPSGKWRSASASIQLQQVVVSGLDRPLYVTNAGDGSNRLFIVEQPGRIKVLQPGATAPTLFLDISQKVATVVEQGLLCLVFYPQLEPNRRFFISYTRQSDGALVIAQYRVSNDPNVADPTETAILIIPQLTIEHHAGMLAFGPDGYLYISAGDSDYGFDPNNFAQNINDLRGKILRIDIDHPAPPLLYQCPASNPFVGNPGDCEIFAYGFRNPWRFSFDPATGQLYAADVGQNNREEVDLVTAGGNYGWRIYEGTQCTNIDPSLCIPSNFIFPIVEYDHTLGRCAIIGGYAYRGTQSTLPSGMYTYGDLCTGEIFGLSNGTSSVLLDSTLMIDSFGQDEAGEIYVVDLNGGVYRIVANLPSSPPVAKCKNVTVAAGANCTANASIDNGSFDPDQGDTITLSQSPPGPYAIGNTLVTLTVTDNHGVASQCQATVTVTDSGQPVFPNGCPAPITVTASASCPFTTSAAASYSTPAATGNCGGNIPVACNPPSGSMFPVGTTTVTCTANGGPNNTGTCSFTVTLYSFCVQDETTAGNFALINAATGDYLFFCNGVLVASGRGTLTVRGCLGSIEHIKGDRRVLIQWDASAQSGMGSGTASVRLGSTTKCSITDKNMSNNSCVAP